MSWKDLSEEEKESIIAFWDHTSSFQSTSDPDSWHLVKVCFTNKPASLKEKFLKLGFDDYKFLCTTADIDFAIHCLESLPEEE